ncbi:MAG: nitroreductase family protein, partial [Pseudomonadales bacterium]
MELYEAFRGTFAARHFTDEPVSDETLARLLEEARFAPSGGNRQGWRVVVVRNPETRAALEPLMLPTMQRYVAEQRAGVSPWNPLGPSRVSAEACAATEVPDALLAPLRTAPVLLFLFLDLGKVAAMDQNLERVGVISGASIYPFAWN